jgi:hypothetical protein
VHPDRCQTIQDRVLREEVTVLFKDAFVKLNRAFALLEKPDSFKDEDGLEEAS